MMWTVQNLHVLPLEDLRDHTAHPTCWCKPIEDDEEPDVYWHTSMDGREAFETGERLPS